MYNSKVTLRCVFGKGVKYDITNPCKDPKTKMYPPHVKKVDSDGNMILTDAERNSGQIFIPIDEQIMIFDGKTFDLDNPREAAEWYAIQFCPLIAKSRDERDDRGNLIIDGSDYTKNGEGRYGMAEFYIENVEAEINRSNSRRAIKNKAENFVWGDNPEHRRVVARLLGRNMVSSIDGDVLSYLLETSDKFPEKVIEAYTGSDNRLKILLMDALEKGVIKNNKGIYIYSDSTVLGGSEEATLNWMKSPENMRLLEAIKRDTYPNYNAVDDIVKSKPADKPVEERPKQKNTITEKA